LIGRYREHSPYRELLQAREFYAVALGICFIALSLVFEKKGFDFWPDLFALGALAVLGGPIILEAAKGLLQKEMNVDELVSLAIIASVIIGEYLSAAVVALIMVLGSLLEEFTAQRARSAIGLPDSAGTRQGRSPAREEEVPVPVEELQLMDRLVIRTGKKSPLTQGGQGRGLAGPGFLNRRIRSRGENGGDEVYAGTVVYSGMLEVEAGKVGEDTALGRLIQLVQEAERQKAPFLRIADRYARYFTPAIIALALIVFLVPGRLPGHHGFNCRLPLRFYPGFAYRRGLSPGNASKNGILVKGGASWRRPRASMRSS